MSSEILIFGVIAVGIILWLLFRASDRNPDSRSDTSWYFMGTNWHQTDHSGNGDKGGREVDDHSHWHHSDGRDGGGDSGGGDGGGGGE